MFKVTSGSKAFQRGVSAGYMQGEGQKEGEGEKVTKYVEGKDEFWIQG